MGSANANLERASKRTTYANIAQRNVIVYNAVKRYYNIKGEIQSMKHTIEPTIPVKDRITEEVHDYTTLGALFDTLGISAELGVKSLNWYFSTKQLNDIHEYLIKELDIVNEGNDKVTTVDDTATKEDKMLTEARDPKLGKKVKQLKGWKIYQGTNIDGEEVFRCFTPDDDYPAVGYADWETDTLEAAISWVTHYDDALESKSVNENLDIDPSELISKVGDNDLKNMVKSAGVKLSGSENKDELVGMAKALAQTESFRRRLQRLAILESSKLKRKKGIPHKKVEESAKSKFLK